MSLKIEVGEFYLSASGEVIEIIIKRSDMFEDVYSNYFYEDGICYGDIRDFDLIAHIPKELHYRICELINDYHTSNEVKDFINDNYTYKVSF